MNALIYQVYVPTDREGNPQDKPNPDIVNASVKSFKEYSDKYEIDYLFENKPTFKRSELPNCIDGRMRFYWAMALCREELMSYDYIIHVDTDIICQKHAKDITKIIRGDFMACRDLLDYAELWYDLFGPLRRCWMYSQAAHHFNFDVFQYFNSGVWISSKRARRLIRDKWKDEA